MTSVVKRSSAAFIEIAAAVEVFPARPLPPKKMKRRLSLFASNAYNTGFFAD